MRSCLILLFIFISRCLSSENVEMYMIDSCGAVVGNETIDVTMSELGGEKPNPVFHLFKRKQKKNKRIVAALLAFPFPFGIVGLHRIYLGTKPYVPVAYIASLGGVFGVLPFIDFWVLLIDKDVERYNDNGKVLMWIR